MKFWNFAWGEWDFTPLFTPLLFPSSQACYFQVLCIIQHNTTQKLLCVIFPRSKYPNAAMPSITQRSFCVVFLNKIVINNIHCIYRRSFSECLLVCFVPFLWGRDHMHYCIAQFDVTTIFGYLRPLHCKCFCKQKRFEDSKPTLF